MKLYESPRILLLAQFCKLKPRCRCGNMMSMATLTLPKVVVTESKEVKGAKAAVQHRICARSGEALKLSQFNIKKW